MEVIRIMNESNPRAEVITETAVHFSPHEIAPHAGAIYQDLLTAHRTPPAYGVQRNSVRIEPNPLGEFVQIKNDRQQLTAQAIRSFNETAARRATT